MRDFHPVIGSEQPQLIQSCHEGGICILISWTNGAPCSYLVATKVQSAFSVSAGDLFINNTSNKLRRL
jgi:hypothetical protein